jgi:hypothetical protein
VGKILVGGIHVKATLVGGIHVRATLVNGIMSDILLKGIHLSEILVNRLLVESGIHMMKSMCGNSHEGGPCNRDPGD